MMEANSSKMNINMLVTKHWNASEEKFKDDRKILSLDYKTVLFIEISLEIGLMGGGQENKILFFFFLFFSCVE